MKLAAFRIRNFRSIVDTGWQTLSPDNITCLIGQNESGKTSILEGLKVFYTGTITEDVLRSDLSLPQVSCRFIIPEGWLLTVTENPGTELKELLSGLNKIELTREWLPDLTSLIVVSGEISNYLNSLEDAWRLYLEDVTAKLKEELEKILRQEETLEMLNAREAEIKTKLPPVTKSVRRFRFFTKKAAGQSAHQDTQYRELNDNLASVQKEKKEANSVLKEKSAVKKAGETWKRIKERSDLLESHLTEISLKLEERHQKMTLLMKPGGEDDDHDWKDIIDDFRKTRKELDQKKAELDRHVALSGYIMEGSTEEDAAIKVSDIIRSYKSQYNTEMLGKKYFEYIPHFELFEDFGSLLPNRIDMEDIISGNEQVEGYKAARNFLSIAQLDYTFFQQPSSRILKQKIENLNQTLTRNFQDFWQQSIGRNNKINIQFELDHYSSSFGERAGKPYLEFWIKDEGERLYPKQRSRGVRWFLSFYMELKAAAGINKPMVLLVDEPGVSLHARAQEDVLKVFEDIKDRIQIIYTTHSPHLVEINRLHRVLAVQRDDIDSVRSTTRIIDPLSLSGASPDTLSPLQSILGNPVSGEGFSTQKLNLVVNDTGSFYITSAIISLMEMKDKVNIIPSTNVSSIPLLCNILMGWGLEFSVLLFGNESELKIAGELQKSVFNTQKQEKQLILRLPESIPNAEDLLSTLDFKNKILKTREGITVTNSEYVREKELPRNFLFSRFLTEVRSGAIKISDFDEETVENFKMLVAMLKGDK
ncbi:MAG TPA: AAA family ATPase [Bacteroidales bacterium]|nr:AAA family ATPase [Bacteroidales bacterium]HPJ60644.1 AAA family ATPase [Bacteroidales bacterium]HPR13561.1 AAA family ATPase [Bacteroidales bacterium]HRW84343.1 AAA family ATPase [Bacteroidales bacterium]